MRDRRAGYGRCGSVRAVASRSKCCPTGAWISVAQNTGAFRSPGSPRPAARLPSTSRRARAGCALSAAGCSSPAAFRIVGPPDEREEERLGLHGRISHTPASNVSREERWDEEGCVLLARGEVRESRVFGPNLMLRRTVSARLGEPNLRVEDEVENEGFRPEPLMLLYHVNLGWPLLDKTARLLGPGAAPEPRDEEAAAGLES